ncbi:MAG TPA: hypothetical protein VFM29_03715 [Vicinamibacteria bacterium]|nr:hypothetical protein [Vicinamibacteria bacterium]
MLLNAEVTAQLEEEFQKLKGPVRLVVFSQALADPESEQVRRLVEEVVALDQRLSLESHNFVLDREPVEKLGIRRIPAIAILGVGADGAAVDHGIRMYGLPSMYEFGTFINAIRLVSGGESGLSAETKEALKEIDRPLHIQVFSTPT